MIKIGFVGGVNAPTGYQSDMPAFESVLTNAQIELILGYIKSGWPEQALAAQREISLQQ
jgi:mono/diheme cytochrome c family protein